MRGKSLILWIDLLLLTILIGFVAPPGRHTATAASLSDVAFADGFLTVSVVDQRFQEVMDAVAHAAGIHIVIEDPADEGLTISFDDLPLEEGLHRLLRGRSYVFVYGSEPSSEAATVRRVLVFPGFDGQRTHRSIQDVERGGSKQTGLDEVPVQTQRVKEVLLEEVLRFVSAGGLDEERTQELRALEEAIGFFGPEISQIVSPQQFEELREEIARQVKDSEEMINYLILGLD